MTQNTILILGGTKEAISIAEQLILEHPQARIIYSIAGRTKEPKTANCETRIGGFGGANGLVSYIQKNNVDKIVDATHPFAVQISANAKLAAEMARIQLEVHHRPQWQAQQGDNWTLVRSFEEADKCLPSRARVLLALGAKLIDTFPNREDIHYVVRMVDPPKAPLHLTNYDLILGRPCAQANEEERTLSKNNISHIVCRNSGGTGAYAKIEAARNLGIEVIMIEPPI